MTDNNSHKILVVDDDAPNARLIESILKKFHPAYEITLAGSGAEAISYATKEQFDIILLDVLLPDIKGFEVCRRIRLEATDYNHDTPVIFITCLGKTEEKIEGFNAGGVDYIVKPIDPPEMLSRIEAHLKIKEYADQLRWANDLILRNQEELVESAKMSAIGSFVTGIAHEFNNVLFMMKGYTQTAQLSRDPEDLEASLRVIHGLVERGSKIVKSLLDFSRSEEQSQKEIVNLYELIETDLKLLKNQFELTGVRWQVEGENAVYLEAYPNELSQVFVNIVKNAIEAMRDTPKRLLTIRVISCTQSGEVCRHIAEHHCLQRHGCAMVTFQDTGSGVPEQIRHKIFEPFVTSKGVTGGGNVGTPGTGLGLFICYGIIKRHGGSIFVESSSAEGSVFRVLLPFTDVCGPDMKRKGL